MAEANPTTNLYDFLQKNHPNLEEIFHITPNPDGTVTRPSDIYPTVPASLTPSHSPSISKDVSLNSANSTWLRLFLPRESLSSSQKKNHPIIVYVHGSGFVVASAAHPNFHDFCSHAASQLGALVVSVEYRLAPEHRLPAAYGDVFEAIKWVKDGKDEWIEEYGDVASCVLMGDSAGANIVYQVGLKVADRVHDFKPLIVKGLIMVQPFFSGLDRTESELRLADDPTLPLKSNDLCWEVALPYGADRSHEYCDPRTGGGSVLLDRVRDLGWKVLVVSCDGDPIFDRSVELIKLLEKRGLSVESMLVEGGEHGIFIGNPSKFKANQLLDFVKHCLFGDH